MATLERAVELAAKHHVGQVDKGGSPYILHPLAVMLSVDSNDEKIVAVLHDIIEDTSVTADDLRSEGFSEQIIEAILALTKHKGESRIEAAHRAAANPIARVVKLADVAQNMDISRIPNPTDKDYIRLEQYREVKAILEEALVK